MKSISNITAAFIPASEYPGFEIKILYYYTLYRTVLKVYRSTIACGCTHVKMHTRHMS